MSDELELAIQNLEDVWKILEGEVANIQLQLSRLKKLQNKETPEISPKTEGTSFADINPEFVEFDVFDATVSKVFDVKAFVRKDGGAGTKQSLIITDKNGLERELLAWEDHTAKFDRVRVGDLIHITCISKVNTYTYKTGKTVVQFTIGSNTEIEIVSNKEENYVL